MVRKWGRDRRKAKPLIRQLPEWVLGAEFHRKTLGNGAKHSSTIISSEDEGADVFYVPTPESYWMRSAREGGTLIPQN